MKNTKIEVEGGEILIQSKEGHYAVIPAKHRREVMDMVKDNCDDCINSYIQGLPKESDYAGDGTLLPSLDDVTSILNPMNWGVNDYTDKGSFNNAYASAKKVGEKEFMYKNKRYNTKYAGTPRQEVGKYGVDGKPVQPIDINHPAQVNLYPAFGRYLPGHIEASIGDNKTSVDYSPEGNNAYGLLTIMDKSRGEKAYNVYGQDNLTFSNKAASLPQGYMGLLTNDEYKPSDWNLFTNNCADNVCDAFGIPRSKGIQTPSGALSKIKEKYPTIDVTGRTYEDYYHMSKSLLNKKSDDVLNQSKNLIGIISSPDLQKSGVSKNITIALQKSLSEKGYKLPKSTKQDGSFDGIYGDETKNALLEYQTNIKTKK